jgi:hypothetical protein
LIGAQLQEVNMAFGPSTTGVQQAILALLQGRNPSDLTPAPLPPTFGAPPIQGEVEMRPMPPPLPPPAPIAAPPALDESLIERLTGPRPVAPTPEPTPFIVRIARALQGFGAGVQGRGPQFLENLREQGEAPMRRYEAEQNIYQNRRAQAVEFAERKREREQAEIQRRADVQSDREFEMWARRQNFVDEEAKRIAREAFDLNKLREQERIADERQEKQQKALDDRQARAYKFQLIREDDAPAHIAESISQHIFNGKPLSAAAEKWRSPKAAKAQAQLARLSGSVAGGTGTGQNTKAAKAWQTFEDIKQQVIQREQVGDAKGAEQLRRKMISVHNSLAGRFPGVFELGYGDSEGKWPYVKPRGQGAQPQAGAPALNVAPRDQMYFDLRGVGPGAQQQPQGPSDAEVNAYAQRFGISPQQARQELSRQ